MSCEKYRCELCDSRFRVRNRDYYPLINHMRNFHKPQGSTYFLLQDGRGPNDEDDISTDSLCSQQSSGHLPPSVLDEEDSSSLPSSFMAQKSHLEEIDMEKWRQEREDSTQQSVPRITVLPASVDTKKRVQFDVKPEQSPETLANTSETWHYDEEVSGCLLTQKPRCHSRNLSLSKKGSHNYKSRSSHATDTTSHMAVLPSQPFKTTASSSQTSYVFKTAKATPKSNRNSGFLSKTFEVCPTSSQASSACPRVHKTNKETSKNLTSTGNILTISSKSSQCSKAVNISPTTSKTSDPLSKRYAYKTVPESSQITSGISEGYPYETCQNSGKPSSSLLERYRNEIYPEPSQTLPSRSKHSTYKTSPKSSQVSSVLSIGHKSKPCSKSINTSAPFSVRCTYDPSSKSILTSEYPAGRDTHETRLKSIQTSTSKSPSKSGVSIKTSQLRTADYVSSETSTSMQTSKSSQLFVPLSKSGAYKLCAKPNCTSIPLSTDDRYENDPESSQTSALPSRNPKRKTDPKSNRTSTALSEYYKCKNWSTSSQTPTSSSQKIISKNRSKVSHTSSSVSESTKRVADTTSLVTSQIDQDCNKVSLRSDRKPRQKMLEYTTESTNSISTKTRDELKCVRRPNQHESGAKLRSASLNYDCYSSTVQPRHKNVATNSSTSHNSDSCVCGSTSTRSYVTSVDTPWFSEENKITCPHCGELNYPVLRRQKTVGRRRAGALSIFSCWPCCMLPFVGSCGAGKVLAYCPSCKKQVGTFHSDTNSVEQIPLLDKAPQGQ